MRDQWRKTCEVRSEASHVLVQESVTKNEESSAYLEDTQMVVFCQVGVLVLHSLASCL